MGQAAKKSVDCSITLPLLLKLCDLDCLFMALCGIIVIILRKCKRLIAVHNIHTYYVCAPFIFETVLPGKDFVYDYKNAIRDGCREDPFDWSVLRPTSPKNIKLVYFPPLEK